mmetsp:Transcript_12294/g.37130  ORF Transcript_12294/g.37130 Transcript_12294/m.37130 type:complete len:232 (-) Transcript_12294:176-871(-)
MFLVTRLEGSIAAKATRGGQFAASWRSTTSTASDDPKPTASTSTGMSLGTNRSKQYSTCSSGVDEPTIGTRSTTAPKIVDSSPTDVLRSSFESALCWCCCWHDDVASRVCCDDASSTLREGCCSLPPPTPALEKGATEFVLASTTTTPKPTSAQRRMVSSMVPSRRPTRLHTDRDQMPGLAPTLFCSNATTARFDSMSSEAQAAHRASPGRAPSGTHFSFKPSSSRMRDST